MVRSRASASASAGHFSDPPLLVLASLAGGPKHGHAILNDIEAMCGTRLGPGTLYGAIARLEHAGLIERLPAVDRRQPYRITSSGTSAFTAKIGKLQRFVAASTARLATS